MDWKKKGTKVLALAMTGILLIGSNLSLPKAEEAMVRKEAISEQETEASTRPSETTTTTEEPTTKATTEEKKPTTTEHKKPAMEHKKTTTEHKKPITQHKKPTTTTRRPTTTTETKKDKDKTKKDSSKKEDGKDKKKTSDDLKQKNILDLTKIKEKEEENDGTSKNKVIPKVYSDHSLEMKNRKEWINGYIYFNQGDSAWNDNGYQIKRAGCGPTSMAVVISSLTGKWVTPVDTTTWAYQHGYYSRAGSSHSLIGALARAYQLECQGLGRSETSIRSALKGNNPVVALMGPGYFTKGGHFMVLVGIDDNDNVTVADVGSRQRSKYKYKLKDIISQSKSASAGGPFWVIQRPNEEVTKTKETQNSKNGSKGIMTNKTEVGSSFDISDYTLGEIKNDKLIFFSHHLMKDATKESVENALKTGSFVMVKTDGNILDKQTFLYLTSIDSEGLVTVADADLKEKKKTLLSEIWKHKKEDATKTCFWLVKGDYELLTPVSK